MIGMKEMIGMNCLLLLINNLIFFVSFTLYTVYSRVGRETQWEPSVKTGGIACWVPELNTALPERINENFLV